MTLLNAAKPIHMDDAVYHMYAAQIAEHPGDPYGGEVVDYWFPPKRGDGRPRPRVPALPLVAGDRDPRRRDRP